MDEIQNQEVVTEEVVEEVVVNTDEATNEVTVVEEVVGEDVPVEVVTEEVVSETVDYQAKASSLEKTVEKLEADLKKVTDSYQTLLTKVEAGEKEALAETRMAELKELGIEFSEARKAKEIEKLSTMDNDAFSDYKDFLAEIVKATVKEEAVEAVITEEVVEEVEVEVEANTATAGLNIETEQPKVIKPFSHLAE